MTFCVLSLEQEKPSTSRRRTIAGGEEKEQTKTIEGRGNKRGHKPSHNNNNNSKREWKLSETDNQSKDKLILKFKHRKKE